MHFKDKPVEVEDKQKRPIEEDKPRRDMYLHGILNDGNFDNWNEEES